MMETPIQVVKAKELEEAGVQLFVKREDLLHPHISGNKWRKLKYNILEAQAQRHDTLLTFGGAFSNHIYATATAGKEHGLGTIGIIRGEEQGPLNPTLQYATDQGMRLHYVNRTEYRQKNHPDFIRRLHEKFGKFYLLPEGGTNILAVKGCIEMVKNLPHFDYICCSCGTGGTLAGILAGLQGNSQVLGFSALKGGEFLQTEIDQLTRAYDGQVYRNFQMVTEFHFGGYAKATHELVKFINAFKQAHNILLDPVYTGKMLFGIFSLGKQGFFEKGSSILAIHTGGLQGIAGFNVQHKSKKMHILVC